MGRPTFPLPMTYPRSLLVQAYSTSLGFRALLSPDGEATLEVRV